MKKLVLFVSVLACACAPLDKYEPKLSMKPTNQAKYQADLISCRTEAKHRYDVASDSAQGRAMVGFGALGYAINSTAPKTDFDKSLGQMVDECFASKGYKVIG